MHEYHEAPGNNPVSFRITEDGPKKHVVSVRITDEEKEQLERIANEASISISAMVRNVLLFFKEGRHEPVSDIFHGGARAGGADNRSERTTWSEVGNGKR